jgi:thiol-disulfide isomerase/thioredoxin
LHQPTASLRRHILLALAALSSAPLLAVDLTEVARPAQVSRLFEPAAKLRVVNIWATWCLPCVKEMPDLQAVDTHFSDADVQIVGVTLDDAIPDPREERKALVRKFLGRYRIGFRTAYYTGRIITIQNYYNFADIPVTLVFDRNGCEVARHEGAVTKARFIRELNALLEKQGDSR